MSAFAFDLHVPEDAWREATDGNRSRLKTVVFVSGCPVHLEAHEVTWEGKPTDRVQVPVGDSDYADLADGFGLHAPVQTLTIAGRTYALFACAFGA